MIWYDGGNSEKRVKNIFYRLFMNTPSENLLEKKARDIIDEYLKNPWDEKLIGELMKTEIGAESLWALWENWAKQEQNPEVKKQWEDASKSAKDTAHAHRMKKHQAKFKKPAQWALSDLQKAKDSAKKAWMSEEALQAVEAIEANLKMILQ